MANSGRTALAFAAIACKGPGPQAPREAAIGPELAQIMLARRTTCILVAGEARCLGDRPAVFPREAPALLGFLGDYAIDAAGRLHNGDGSLWSPSPVPATIDRAALRTGGACLYDGRRLACLDPYSRGWSTPLKTTGVRAAAGTHDHGCVVDDDRALRCWSPEDPLRRPLGPGAPPLRALAPESGATSGCAITTAGEVVCWDSEARPCRADERSRLRGECHELALDRPVPRSLGEAVAVSYAQPWSSPRSSARPGAPRSIPTVASGGACPGCSPASAAQASAPSLRARPRRAGPLLGPPRRRRGPDRRRRRAALAGAAARVEPRRALDRSPLRRHEPAGGSALVSSRA